MFLVLTRMPGGRYRSRFRSLLLGLYDALRVSTRISSSLGDSSRQVNCRESECQIRGSIDPGSLSLNEREERNVNHSRVSVYYSLSADSFISSSNDKQGNTLTFFTFFTHALTSEIIIMYIYHALINALSAHTIHINLYMIFYTHVEHSPTKTITQSIIYIYIV